jgi:hypothetical protein
MYAMCYLVYVVQFFCSAGPDYESVIHIMEMRGRERKIVGSLTQSFLLEVLQKVVGYHGG